MVFYYDIYLFLLQYLSFLIEFDQILSFLTKMLKKMTLMFIKRSKHSIKRSNLTENVHIYSLNFELFDIIGTQINQIRRDNSIRFQDFG